MPDKSEKDAWYRIVSIWFNYKLIRLIKCNRKQVFSVAASSNTSSPRDHSPGTTPGLSCRCCSTPQSFYRVKTCDRKSILKYMWILLSVLHILYWRWLLRVKSETPDKCPEKEFFSNNR